MVTLKAKDKQGEWIDVPGFYQVGEGGGGIIDVPSDGKTYGRKDKRWTEIPSKNDFATINGKSIINGGNIEIDGGSGAINYNELSNKPQINNVELNGNKTIDELGLQKKGDYALKTEIPSVTNLATKDELNIVDGKIGNINSILDKINGEVI